MPIAQLKKIKKEYDKIKMDPKKKRKEKSEKGMKFLKLFNL